MLIGEYIRSQPYSRTFSHTHCSLHRSASKADRVPNSPDLDSMYAWLVCLALFAVNTIGVGQTYSYSINLPQQLAAFNYSKFTTSWAGVWTNEW